MHRGRCQNDSIDISNFILLLLLRIIKSWDPLTMDYFDNFDNEPLNKYKKK
jgi:hypothetical protein